MTFSHENVYTRLGISIIDGVGVIAIVDIPKGTVLFTGDKSEMVWFKEEELELDKLPEEIRKLYKDFCVIIKKDDSKIYGCPDNFNNITMSWYLNHSNNPNVCCDKDYNFYAISEIMAGDELTVDYHTYSDE